MALKIYNTLTRKKEIFKPIKKGKVNIYTCGPTIYNHVHIGNLRAYVFSDVLKRSLKFMRYEVKDAMNLTDVDDKTIQGSQKEGKGLKDFTKKYEKSFLEDLNAINISLPKIMPKATEHIKEMIDLINILLNKKIAYKTKDGIYFSIKKFKTYGKLSRINLGELKAVKRTLKDEYEKKNVNDFALWKFYSKEDNNVFWNADFGKGRPGWHIECSAMSMKHLGKNFDIHIGGEDLIFPHHENEIAQSEATTGKKFVNYWMHNGWLLVDNKKMSKSLKNFYNLKDIIKKGYGALDLRYFYLTKIYRQKFNFSWKNLEASKIARHRLKNIISKIRDDNIYPKGHKKVTSEKINKKYLKEFEKAINDDINTPKALQVLWNLVRDEKAQGKFQTIKKIDEVFGLDLLKKEVEKIPKEIKKIAEQRKKYRKEKDWKKSDDLRKKINKAGYIIGDIKKGYVLKKR